VVTSTRNRLSLRIVAQPNCSASWQTNQRVLFLLAIPSLIAATGFALLGAWPILPIAGLELLTLGGALYYVNWKLQYRHVITLSDEAIRIDKGFYAPRETWTFARDDTGLAITPEKHPWDGPELSVHSHHQRVSVGEFLNRDDCLKLAGLLKKELRVGTHSAVVEHRF
jgi:uncharacterized membrane protein